VATTPHPHLESRHPRRALALLALGLVTGAALTAAGVLGESADAKLPAGAIATVNGRVISRAAYERLVAGLAGDKRDGLTADDRRHVLDRLIDEELLVQRALELDLVRNEASLRGSLASAMMTAAIGQASIAEPSRAQLEAFFAEDPAQFAGAGRLRVRRVLVAAEPARTATEAEERARGAAQRLRAGEAFASVSAALGDRVAAELPDSMLNARELRGYLGPTAARSAAELRDGQVSEPVRSAAGFQVLQVVQRDGVPAPEFADVEDEVRAEWKRRQEERALRAYLDDLRAGADVTLGTIP
jgi:parvulin-like peptidyl-prolyl isomerase